MGRLKDKQWGWSDIVLLVTVLGLAVFLVPLFLVYVIAHPSATTMAMAFGMDLAIWIVAGVVGALAWSIYGARRIAICTSCGKVSMVAAEGVAVCARCGAPL